MIFYHHNQPVQSCPYQHLPAVRPHSPCLVFCARLSIPIHAKQHFSSTLHLCPFLSMFPDLAKCYVLPELMIYSLSV